MTPEEIAAAQEARAVEAHAAYMAASAAYLLAITDSKAAVAAAAARAERVVAAQEAVAAELPRSQRLAMLVDSATERVTDRTAATGRADIPASVAEAVAILAEVERQITPLPPPILPPDPPKPPGA